MWGGVCVRGREHTGFPGTCHYLDQVRSPMKVRLKSLATPSHDYVAVLLPLSGPYSS